MSVIFSANIANHHVVPAVRMTQKSKFANPSAKKYIAHQQMLAMVFRSAFISKDTITTDCSLSFVVYYADRRRRDIDNVCKSVMDALQQAQVIKNDDQVKELRAKMLYSKEEQLTVTLRNMGEQNESRRSKK